MKPGCDSLPERVHLNAVKPGAVVCDLGKSLVRINRCVPMAWEVLEHRQDSGTLKPRGKGNRLVRHPGAVFAKRACADDRVCRVGVDIGDRRKVYVHTDSLALPSDLTTEFLYQIVIRDAAQHGIAREGWHRLNPHPEPPLAVKTYHGRGLAEADYHVVHGEMLLKRASGEVYSTQLHVLDVIAHGLAVGIVLLRGDIDHKQLGNPFTVRHPVHDRIRPLQRTLIVLRQGVYPLSNSRRQRDDVSQQEGKQ